MAIISRLDLPRIVEAAHELHRTISYPPTRRWKPPIWLVEQYRQTTLGGDGVPTKPLHSYLIDAAATEVLNRLMPPWHHSKRDCPEITDSLLDMKHKVVLIKLRQFLLNPFLGQTLASNRSDARETLDFIESVLETLV